MTRTNLRPLLVLLPMLVLASGCLDLDFDPPSIVKGTRILAITANPPEALFGEDVHFEALIVDAAANDLTVQDGVEVRWTVCLALGEIFAAAGLGASSGLDDGCAEGDGLVVLEQDGAQNRAVLPGEVLAGAVNMIPMGPPDMPPPDPMIPGVDPDVLATLSTVIAEVGIPLQVRMEVRQNDVLILSGFKRFAITTRSGATLNPPPPRFGIDGTVVSARATGDPHVCVTADGEAPIVAPEAEVDLTPDENEEAWIEHYPVFDLQGGIIENSESAYYSWFSTAGAFSEEISQRPLRDTVWTAPAEAGTYPIILVIRDGHLGGAWCVATVRVR